MRASQYSPWGIDPGKKPTSIVLIKNETIHVTWDFYQAGDLSFKEIVKLWLGRNRQYETHQVVRRPVNRFDRRRYTGKRTYSVAEEMTT